MVSFWAKIKDQKPREIRCHVWWIFTISLSIHKLILQSDVLKWFEGKDTKILEESILYRERFSERRHRNPLKICVVGAQFNFPIELKAFECPCKTKQDTKAQPVKT
jgi:hypothetical protein